MDQKLKLPFTEGSEFAGRYEILRVVGAGSVGCVLQVADRQLDGEILALKVLHDGLLTSNEMRRRLQAEVIIARQLSHPHIVRVYEFEKVDNSFWYLSMEFVEGCNLLQLIKHYGDQGIPYDDARYLLNQVLQGLSFAHQKGVIHRDIKPENILIDRRGVIKLSDFGIASCFDQDLGVTRTGQLIGTPTHMAPELFTRQDYGVASDIYALGVTAYQVLTGRLPFEGNSLFDLAQAHRLQALNTDLLQRRAVPEATIEMLEECLNKDPRQRPATTQVVQSRLGTTKDSVSDRHSLQLVIEKYQPKQRLTQRPLGLVQFVFGSITWLAALLILFLVEAAQDRVALDLYRLDAFYDVDTTPIRKILGYGYDPNNLEDLKSVLNGEDPERFVVLLRSANNLEMSDEYGRTLLHYLAESSFSYLAKLLAASLPHKLPLEQRDVLGETPLHRAILTGSYLHVKLLVHLGSRLDAVTTKGDAPLHLAVQLGDISVLRALFSESGGRNSLRLNQFDAEGNTALHLSVRLKRPDIVEALLDEKVDPNMRDRMGRTPLMLLIEGEYSEAAIRMAERLLEAGASVQTYDNQGRNITQIISLPENHWRPFLEARSISLPLEKDST